MFIYLWWTSDGWDSCWDVGVVMLTRHVAMLKTGVHHGKAHGQCWTATGHNSTLVGWWNSYESRWIITAPGFLQPLRVWYQQMVVGDKHLTSYMCIYIYIELFCWWLFVSVGICWWWLLVISNQPNRSWSDHFSWALGLAPSTELQRLEAPPQIIYAMFTYTKYHIIGSCYRQNLHMEPLSTHCRWVVWLTLVNLFKNPYQLFFITLFYFDS